MNADIRIENHGSVFLARPLTDAGKAAVNTILEGNEEAQSFGGALVVEHSYIMGIVDAFREDFGLEVL